MSLLVEALWARCQAATGLTALIGSRLYGNHEVPQGATRPYVSFGTISDTPVYSLNSASGNHDTRWQFDVWDNTYLGAKQVAEQLRLALDGTTGTNLSVDFHVYLVNIIDVPEQGAQSAAGVALTHIAADFVTQATQPLS